MAKLIDVYNIIDEFAPFSTQLVYDNCGIKLGEMNKEITGILVTLDTTVDVVMEAKKMGCNLIIEHHPSIWNPLLKIDYSLPLSNSLVTAIKFDIALISTHTNVDFAKDGLNDYMAKKMGLHNIHCMSTIESARIGELETAVTLREYAETLGKLFNEKNVLTVGDLDKKIKKVGVINGGGGGDTTPIIDSYNLGCDVFVTSDVKHHVARLAKDLNYGIIELSHHASEIDFVPLMVDKLKNKLKNTSVFGTNVLENPYN
jgi:dinuclear metal center YbgI/SA1388 family protein